MINIFKEKKTIYLFAIATLGIILIVIAPLFSEKNFNMKNENELEKYIINTENRLQNTVSSIKGAGKTQVFISVENTFETVYASNASINERSDDINTNKTTQKELAYSTGKDKSEEPVVVKQICPKISGILVVCEGGENTVIREEIIYAVSTAVGVPTSKIYVTGGNH